jgi:RHH-type proline utilization regulon transcriptional repressor/proline dehydrogenase/delta 1-pyrroline-5-carboxylate dehydrogenase
VVHANAPPAAHDPAREGRLLGFETAVAHAEGWPVPVFETKAATDANYERCVRYLVEHAGGVRVASGSHNVRSIAFAVAAARARGLPDAAVEHQLLYGMAEPVHTALRRLGLRVRVYAPVGDLVAGMAYLVRRLLENTSNESFIRHRWVEGQALDALIAPPVPMSPGRARGDAGASADRRHGTDGVPQRAPRGAAPADGRARLAAAVAAAPGSSASRRPS